MFVRADFFHSLVIMVMRIKVLQQARALLFQGGTSLLLF